MLIKKNHLSVLPVAALLIMGCHNRSAIEYVTPEIKVVDHYITITGNVITEAENQMNITSPAAGRIIAVAGRQNQFLPAGETLASIENTDFIAMQQEYLEALNLFEFFRDEYTRQGDLTVENATSIKKMQIARRDYQTAELKYQSLALQLKILGISTDSIKPDKLISALSIFSPRSGTVSQTYINIGDYVDKGDLLFEITGRQNHVIELRIPENNFLAVRPGQTLNCFSMVDSLTAIEATIRTIVPKIDPVNHFATIYAEMNESGNRMIPGMSVTAKILAWQDTVLLLSSTAVIDDRGNPFIFVRQNGNFDKIPVTPGLTAKGITEIRITGNLPDSVVISGFEKVHSLFNHQ